VGAGISYLLAPVEDRIDLVSSGVDEKLALADHCRLVDEGCAFDQLLVVGAASAAIKPSVPARSVMFIPFVPKFNCFPSPRLG
jgi:hypothetical protein